MQNPNMLYKIKVLNKIINNNNKYVLINTEIHLRKPIYKSSPKHIGWKWIMLIHITISFGSLIKYWLLKVTTIMN